jgi:PAS domain S-box-containing protein
VTDCAIVLLDRLGQVLSWNAGAQRILGYPAAEILGEHFSRFFTPEESAAGKPDAELEVATALGRLERVSQRCNKAGTPFWANITTTALRGADGEVIAFSHLLRDISAPRWNDDALRSSERKFSAAFHGSSDLIFLSRLDTGEILEVNLGFERMTGYFRSEVVGRNAIAVDLWTDPVQRAALIARVTAGNTVFDVESSLRRKDGSLRTVLLWIDAVELGGELCTLCIGRDITQQKAMQHENAALELQLRESQKMEALGTLAGGVAHDFNNALAVIAGNVELARADLMASHPAIASLDEIGKAARRARNLVLQILAFGRRQPPERKAIGLCPVVTDAARLLRATLPANVTLNLHCDPAIPTVLADGSQIEQVLLNLCSNAWQAPPVPGRPRSIEVDLSPHEQANGHGVRGLKPGRYACLSVRDNGPGMDEATRQRIFEPFFTTKPVGEGTGLGLAVVHTIVQAHEASIRVDTTPGTGSLFRVYFPAIEQVVPVVALPDALATPEQGHGERVLYVDDEEAIVLLTKRLLERHGYRVTGYSNPRAALAAVQADPEQFDLVVTDYNMPGLSGLELAEALKALRPALPVLMISGYITDELQHKAPAAGIRELIYKPDTVEALCRAVDRAAKSLHSPDTQGRNFHER